MSSASSILGVARRQVSRQFARYGRFSRSFDRLNRLPLLRDFARAYPDAPDFPTREAMWAHVAARYVGAVDVLEFGVHEGYSLFHWARLNRTPDSRFFGFDTFEGLPEHWNAVYPKGHFDRGGQPPATDDARVRFVTGLFQDTLSAFLATYEPRFPLVVHIDCDLYSSTLYCLTKLDPILRPGTIVVFDEFGDVQHEFRAFTDYCASYRRQARLVCTHDSLFTAAVEMS